METEMQILQEIADKINNNKTRTENEITEIKAVIKELQAKSGRFGMNLKASPQGLRDTIQAGIHSALNQRKDEIAESVMGGLIKPLEFKSVGPIGSSNLSGDNYISYADWQPGMEPTGQFHFRNLVRTILTATDFVQFPRANTPIGEGSFARVNEGDTKPQVDRDWTMIDVTLKPMAAYTIASRQSLRNIIFLQSWLPQSLMNQMEDQEDVDFCNTLVTAATGSTTTTKTKLPEKLISYMKTLIKGKYNPTAICVDPDVWEDLLTFSPGTNTEMYSLPQPVTVTSDGVIKLLNRPVYPCNWLTNRRIIVGDWTKAAIVQSENFVLRQSDSHASLFTQNQIAFLAERTEALAIFRTSAFITTVV